MGEGDDLGYGRVKKNKNMEEKKYKNMTEKKREIALQDLRCV